MVKIPPHTEQQFQDEEFGKREHRFENWMEDGLSEDDCWDYYYQLWAEWAVRTGKA